MMNILKLFKTVEINENEIVAQPQEKSQAALVHLYRNLQSLEAEHKVSRLNATDLSQQLDKAIDREGNLADNVSLTRRALAKAMAEYENMYGSEIAIEAEGQIITRVMFSFIRRKVIREASLVTHE